MSVLAELGEQPLCEEANRPLGLLMSLDEGLPGHRCSQHLQHETEIGLIHIPMQDAPLVFSLHRRVQDLDHPVDEVVVPVAPGLCLHQHGDLSVLCDQFGEDFEYLSERTIGSTPGSRRFEGTCVLFGDGVNQGLLVGEVSIQGRLPDAGRSSDLVVGNRWPLFAQGDPSRLQNAFHVAGCVGAGAGRRLSTHAQQSKRTDLSG